MPSMCRDKLSSTHPNKVEKYIKNAESRLYLIEQRSTYHKVKEESGTKEATMARNRS